MYIHLIVFCVNISVFAYFLRYLLLHPPFMVLLVKRHMLQAPTCEKYNIVLFIICCLSVPLPKPSASCYTTVYQPDGSLLMVSADFN